MSVRPPLWRRILFRATVVLLVLVLFAGAAVGFLWWRVPDDNLQPLQPGTLTTGETAGGILRFGGFEAGITEDSVTISRISDAAVVWRNDPGTAFLAAGTGKVEFTERLGSLWADVSRDLLLTDQELLGATAGQALELTGRLTGRATAPFSATFTPTPDGDALRLSVIVGDTTDGEPVDSVMLTSGRDEGESVHGLGEQYRAFDLDGSVTPILAREQGIGRGEQPITFLADVAEWAGGDRTTTYAAWPSYVTDANRALALADVPDSGAFGIADLSVDTQARLESWAPTLTADIFVGDSPADVIAAREAGRVRPPLADWVQDGAVLGLQGGTEKVRRVVSEMQAAGARISGVWLQDWTGQRTTSFGDRLWWNWQLDRQRYPGWEDLVASLNADGIEVLTYLNPWLVDASAKGDDSVRNLYAEAAQAGYLVQRSDGGPYLADQGGFEAALMDFTNPAARDWYADVIAEEVIGAGAAGFMADFGEGLPLDGVLSDGTPLREHNRYPQLWASVVAEGCARAGLADCLSFMRASYLASPEHVPMMWAGDQLVTFSGDDGLASAVLGMHAGGVSGSPLWHSDIGGYTSVDAVVKDYRRPADLNARWAELEAFGVMMRTHEGNRPAANAQVYDTPESRAAFAKSTRIFAALADYRRGVVAEAVATGVPARRHSWLVYPGTAAAGADLQFFLGAHLLVAPVTRGGADTVEVTFPPGRWVHALTGEEFEGDTVAEVAAPLGTPAAFVRKGDPVGREILAALQGIG